MTKQASKITLLISWLFLLGSAAGANTRTIETLFTLSADVRSEYNTQFQIFSPGLLLIEASWADVQRKAKPVPLQFVILRPDGSEAARKDGSSALRLEHSLSELELSRFETMQKAKWSVKILNEAISERS